MENPNNLKLSGGPIAIEIFEAGNGIHKEDQNWTNERHLDFLSSLENNFVKNILQKRCPFEKRHIHRLENIQLDRYVPDSSESTRDFHTIRTTSHSVQISKSGRRHNKERPTAHPYKISHDEQVVPQLQKKDGKGRQ